MGFRKAFTMLELIFVIVIIGILAKFGVEFIIQAYDSYIFSTVQNRLQTQTEVALEQVANRLQYRIKPSVIVRDNDTPFANGSWRSLSNALTNGKETILEWVGYDIDGLRGTSLPYWSGFIDLDNTDSNSTQLVSLNTNTIQENNLTLALSNGNSNISNSAIFFTGANSDVMNGYGWDGVAINDQNHTAHPIKTDANVTHLIPKSGNFSGRDVYEFYQLAWTAYALVYSGTNDSNNTLYAQTLDGGAGSSQLFSNVMTNPVYSSTQNGGWTEDANNSYTLHIDNQSVVFTYDPTDGSFDCNITNVTTGNLCKRLTQ